MKTIKRTTHIINSINGERVLSINGNEIYVLEPIIGYLIEPLFVGFKMEGSNVDYIVSAVTAHGTYRTGNPSYFFGILYENGTVTTDRESFESLEAARKSVKKRLI